MRGADHMLSENGTMFVDLDWLLNASSPLSASAELLVAFSPGLSALKGKIIIIEFL